MNLRPYQIEGVEWLRKRKHALLADSMRLGKSAQAITALSEDYGVSANIGIVSPASVVLVWQEQIEKWWKGSRPTIQICSYDSAVRGAFDGEKFDALVIDESHYLKNPDAQRTKKVYGPKCDGVGGLVAGPERVFELSGTPMPNNPLEMWPKLRALAPETIPWVKGPMTQATFESQFCIIRDGEYGRAVVGGKNHEKLKKMIAPFFLRRTFAEISGDVKEPVFDTLPVRGRAPDESELKKLIKHCKTDDEIIATIKKHAVHLASIRRLTGLAKVKGVVDWFRDFNEGQGGKVVFMAYHRDVIHELSVGLSGVVGEKVPVVMGGMAAHVKALSIKRFEQGAPVFVGQIESAGVGIDLSSADTLVFVESDWVPGNNAQAAMRIQKVGKLALLTILSATLPGSIDEKIQQANLRKVRDSALIFG